jgi:(2Fe-2S) ferredoxin
MRLCELIEEKGISDAVRVVGTTCLGFCEEGLVMVIYPDNVWYAGVGFENLEKIVDEHLIGGKVVEDLRLVKEDP